MKIAVISSGFFPVVDGVSVAVYNRLRILSQGGHQVLLLCPNYSALEQTYPDWKDYIGCIFPNVNVVNLPSQPALGLEFERDVKPEAYNFLVEKLQAFEPNIIQIDEPERLFCCFRKLPGVSFAKQNQIPCFCFFHTNYIEYVENYLPAPKVFINCINFFLRLLFIWIYNSYDVTLVSNQVTLQKITQMGIRNALYEQLLGVDLDKFDASYRKKQFFQQEYGFLGVDDKVKLLFVGRLTPDKGWAFTYKAFEKLNDVIDLNRIAVIIVGDGPLRQQISERLGTVMSDIYFTGRISPEQMPALFANSDIHVTNSEKETTGLTVLEACAAKIPVIAPCAGGVVDNIKDGWNGFIYQSQEVTDFISKLALLVQDSSLRQEMGQNGRDYVNNLTWEKAAKKMIHIWENQIS